MLVYQRVHYCILCTNITITIYHHQMMVESPFAGHFTIKINTHLQFIYSLKDDQGPLTIKVHWLVVSIPLKNMSSSDWIIPIWLGKINFMFQSPPTSPIFHDLSVALEKPSKTSEQISFGRWLSVGKTMDDQRTIPQENHHFYRC